MNDSNAKVSMIKTDGLVWWGPSYLVPELTKLGYLMVINPKRSYYIEHDQTLPSYKKLETVGEMHEDDMLEGELI